MPYTPNPTDVAAPLDTDFARYAAAEFRALKAHIATQLALLAPKTGTGTSGTWPISISGNAATATSATTANNATTAETATNATQLGGIAASSYALKGIPRRTSGLANGECLSTSAGLTLNTSDMAAGYAFTIVNASAAPITITKGSGVTLYNCHTGTDGNATLAARSAATIWCDSSSVGYISGTKLS